MFYIGKTTLISLSFQFHFCLKMTKIAAVQIQTIYHRLKLTGLRVGEFSNLSSSLYVSGGDVLARAQTTRTSKITNAKSFISNVLTGDLHHVTVSFKAVRGEGCANCETGLLREKDELALINKFC